MSKSRNLRVAADGEAPAKPEPPMTLAQAVDGGTYLEILVAQRREMIADVREVAGPAKAALHRQIALHSKEIASLTAEAEQEANEGAEVPDEAFSAESV